MYPKMKQQSPMDMHGFEIKGYPGPPGWGLGKRLTISPYKTIFVEKLLKLENGRKQQRRHSTNKHQQLEMWNVLSLYRKQFLKNLIILYINTF
jgi:hypothetical protein